MEMILMSRAKFYAKQPFMVSSTIKDELQLFRTLQILKIQVLANILIKVRHKSFNGKSKNVTT